MDSDLLTGLLEPRESADDLDSAALSGKLNAALRRMKLPEVGSTLKCGCDTTSCTLTYQVREYGLDDKCGPGVRCWYFSAGLEEEGGEIYESISLAEARRWLRTGKAE